MSFPREGEKTTPSTNLVDFHVFFHLFWCFFIVFFMFFPPILLWCVFIVFPMVFHCFSTYSGGFSWVLRIYLGFTGQISQNCPWLVARLNWPRRMWNLKKSQPLGEAGHGRNISGAEKHRLVYLQRTSSNII